MDNSLMIFAVVFKWFMLFLLVYGFAFIIFLGLRSISKSIRKYIEIISQKSDNK